MSLFFPMHIVGFLCGGSSIFFHKKKFRKINSSENVHYSCLGHLNISRKETMKISWVSVI